jgi:hypothetical protein
MSFNVLYLFDGRKLETKNMYLIYGRRLFLYFCVCLHLDNVFLYRIDCVYEATIFFPQQTWNIFNEIGLIHVKNFGEYKTDLKYKDGDIIDISKSHQNIGPSSESDSCQLLLFNSYSVFSNWLFIVEPSNVYASELLPQFIWKWSTTYPPKIRLEYILNFSACKPIGI